MQAIIKMKNVAGAATGNCPCEADDFHIAAEIVRKGGVIAYPTESVYGIGCSPLQISSLQRVLDLKKKKKKKGLIIVAADLDQINCFIDENRLNDCCRRLMEKYWPGPYTIILPARKGLPELLTGGRDSIAMRVSADDNVRNLCRALDSAVVSTSCNVSGEESLTEYPQVIAAFGEHIDFVINRKTGGRKSPSTIIDGLTGKVLRGKIDNG